MDDKINVAFSIFLSDEALRGPKNAEEVLTNSIGFLNKDEKIYAPFIVNNSLDIEKAREDLHNVVDRLVDIFCKKMEEVNE